MKDDSKCPPFPHYHVAVTEFSPLRSKQSGDSRGPGQVASPEYRENYGRIFGTKPEMGQA